MSYTHAFLGMDKPEDVIGLHLMQGTITLLLVVVCLNVAILVYARTATRQAEIAVRSALGVIAAAPLVRATRGDLVEGNEAVILPFVVALFMIAVGFLAALGPARRGLRIQPTEVLRDE